MRWQRWHSSFIPLAYLAKRIFFKTILLQYFLLYHWNCRTKCSRCSIRSWQGWGMENLSPVGEYFLKLLLSGAGGREMSCFTTGTCFILQLLEVFGSSPQLQAQGAAAERAPPPLCAHRAGSGTPGSLDQRSGLTRSRQNNPSGCLWAGKSLRLDQIKRYRRCQASLVSLRHRQSSSPSPLTPQEPP